MYRSQDTKLKLIERINKLIENTKLQKIAIWLQKERITTYVFLREVIIDTLK